MVKLQSLFKEATEYIPKEEAAVLACGLFGCDRGGLILKMNNDIPCDVSEKYREYVKKAANGMPVAYILGKREFYSLDFIVTDGVLIPRPDTEILVDEIIPFAEGKKVLDICCGSGCIGISISKNAPCDLTMIDISEKALAVTKQNCSLHNVEAKLIKADILNDEIEGEFDIVVSNPPYIESDVVLNLDKNVRDFEPHLALDGGADGLVFYPIICEKAKKILKKDGILAFEIGYNQGVAVSEIMKNAGFKNVRVIKDLAENDRVVTGIY